MNRYEICSNALIQIGAGPITDFESGSKESQVCARIFVPTVEHWLSMYWWRFATRERELARLTKKPEQNWNAVYQQPADMIAAQAVKVNGVNVPFDRFEHQIHLDAGENNKVICTYTYAINETYWPPYFEQLIELALMHKLAFALPSKLDLRRELQDDVDAAFRYAKAADSRQQTSRKLPVAGRRSIMEARLS